MQLRENLAKLLEDNRMLSKKVAVLEEDRLILKKAALNLWETANKVCAGHARPTLTLLRMDAQLSPAKVAQGIFGRIAENAVSL